MRFYHMADIHLGAQPDRERPFSEQRRQEIWDTFRSVIRRAGQAGLSLYLRRSVSQTAVETGASGGGLSLFPDPGYGRFSYGGKS